MNNIFRKDGPWSWLCMVAVFFVFFIVGGTDRSFGIWYVEILENFGESAAISASINGVNAGLRNLLSPLVSALCHRWPTNYVAMSGGFIFGSATFVSAWVTSDIVLLFTYGVIGGIGVSLTFLASFKTLSDYFDKYKGIVFAVAQTGFGFGSIFISIVYSYLFNNLSYFEAVTIIAGILLNLMVFGAIYMPRTEIKEAAVVHKADEENIEFVPRGPASKTETTPAQSKFHFNLLTMPIVWTIVIPSIVYVWCGYPYGILIVDFAVERGNSEVMSSTILTIVSAAEFPVRLLVGLLVQHKRMAKYRFYIWSFMCFGGGLTAFATTLCRKLSDFMIAASIMIAFSGCFYTCGQTLLPITFEDSVVADIMSLQLFGVGTGMSTGPLLAGALRDLTGSYVVSFCAMASFGFVSTLPLLMIPYLIKRFGHNKRWNLK